MILHFIKRDFISHRLPWIVLGLLTFLSVKLFASSHLIYMGLLYAYLLFAMTPMGEMTGAKWRSQHVMSRSYLLALPVERKKLFWITQARALVFFLPLIALAYILPTFLPEAQRLYVNFVPKHFPFGLYHLLVLLMVVWLLNTMISLPLGFEKVWGYPTQRGRMLAYVRLIGVFLFELFLIILSCSETYFYASKPVFPLAVTAFLAFERFYLARRSWLTSL
ncbi:MAG TPA: hypothetical protein VIJ93_04125 [bacterium]